MISLVLPLVSWNIDQRNRRCCGLCPWDLQLMARKLNGYLNFHWEIGAAAKPDVPSRLNKVCGPAGAGEGTGVSQLVLTSCKFYWKCGRNFTWNIHDFNQSFRDFTEKSNKAKALAPAPNFTQSIAGFDESKPISFGNLYLFCSTDDMIDEN